MGDRANIFIVDHPKAADDDMEAEGIYLYTHWSGSSWPEELRKALDLPTARQRWNDSSYLVRILADALFKDIRDEETGGGIATFRVGGEYPMIIIDTVAQTVSFAPEGDEQDRNNWRHALTFTEYTALEQAAYPPGLENRW